LKDECSREREREREGERERETIALALAQSLTARAPDPRNPVVEEFSTASSYSRRERER
jgi:hypothetical protein